MTQSNERSGIIGFLDRNAGPIAWGAAAVSLGLAIGGVFTLAAGPGADTQFAQNGPAAIQQQLEFERIVRPLDTSATETLSGMWETGPESGSAVTPLDTSATRELSNMLDNRLKYER